MKLFFIGILGDEFFDAGYAGGDVGVVADNLFHTAQGCALKDCRHRAVWHLQGLDELADGAAGCKVAFGGLFHGNVHLGDCRKPAAAGLHRLYKLD